MDQQYYRSIARKLLFYIVLSSSSITLVFTIISFVMDYQNEKDQLNKVFFFIEKTNLTSIGNAVYMLQEDQIKSQADGIFNHPDIIEVSIKDEFGDTILSRKQMDSDEEKAQSKHLLIVEMLPFLEGHTESKDFKLSYAEEQTEVGILSVTLSKDEMYKRIAEKMIVFFGTQFIKTLIVSMFVLFLFNFLITKHLQAMARFLLDRKGDLSSSEPQELKLDRTAPKMDDEIEILTSAVNEMYSDSWQTKKAILENINQAILTVSKDFRIGSEFSKNTTAVFGIEDIAGRDFSEILENSDLDESNISHIRSTITSAIGMDRLFFEVNAHLLPSQFQYWQGGHRKTKPTILEALWDIIPDHNKISRVIVSFKDVTYLKEVEEEFEKNRQESKIVQELVAAGVWEFQQFHADWHSALQNTSRFLEGGDFESLLMQLHTLKGSAKIMGFSGIANVVHLVEDHFQKTSNRSDSSVSKMKIQQVLDEISNYEQVFAKYFGGKIEKSIVPMTAATMAKEYLPEHRQPVGDADRFIDVYTKIDLQIASIVQMRAEFLPKLSAKLGKDNPSIILKGGEIFVKRQVKKVLSDVLNHLTLNSLDHGIENPDDRKAAAKPSAGKISMEFDVTRDALTMTYEDDGRGLNLARIRELKNLNQSTPDVDVAEYIFEAEFSTAKKVTEISGRGIGLSAVRKILADAQGDIKLKFTADAERGHRQFRFDLTIPLTG